MDLVTSDLFERVYRRKKYAWDTLKVQKIESVICVPLINGSQTVGVMYVDSLKRPDGFRKDDLLTLLNIGQRVALAVETDRLASDLAEVARNLVGDVED